MTIKSRETRTMSGSVHPDRWIAPADRLRALEAYDDLLEQAEGGNRG